MTDGQPRTRAPGIPEGTRWYGGPLEWFAISLRITGATVDAERIAGALGRRATERETGARPILPDGSLGAPKPRRWYTYDHRDEAGDREDVEAGLFAFLRTFPEDLAVWRQLSSAYELSIVVAVRMRAANKGFELSPALTKWLGDRDVKLGFDIYFDPSEERESQTT